MSAPGEEPRDDHLRQALRHAPDADTPVPAALRDSILRAARTPPAPKAAPWWSRLSAWLVQPQVAGAFASVAVVTVAGVMWWHEPVPRMEVPPAASVSAPAAVPSPVPAPAPSPSPAVVARSESPPPVMKPAPEAQKRRVQAPAAEPRPEQRVAEVAREAAPAGAMAPPPPAAPPPAPADMAERSVAADTAAAPPAPAAAFAPKPEAARLRAPATERRATAVPTPPVPLADLRAALAATPTHWTWQREPQATHPTGPALADWLTVLEATAADRWSPATGPRAGAAELRLLHDGTLAHRWVVTDDAVWWYSPAGLWRAPLDGPAARRLLDALATLE